MSFWDDEFKHVAHGRVNNWSLADDVIISKHDSTSIHEGLLRSLHQAETSSLFLIDRLRASKQRELKFTTDLDVAK